ncbi:hypothetical protein PFICI_14729 [Pestalotiopsis fici W106-1]|uniref:lytic cellulose monooxygenase (C4-dehydrogenating) n=1 Tax=Pestalotiopsis fici (strain W106-1 / CGMCC3.15140) TaxID=1229662 RepID=W3WIT8_PESFW|nr:uncharacterized protein PFICI_14729 [Pestalotiopsis fici W106-1]ETS73783.1 hypothetical protein PFICI_14729 [Pestalotiopsis fici W106-1]
MLRLPYITVLMALILVSEAHFTFVRISVNGEWHEPLRFIRNKTAPFTEPWTPNTNRNERIYNEPTYATDLAESTRCGRDNMAYAAATEVLSLRAGDTIEFAHTRFDPVAWVDAMWYDCPNERGSCAPNRADQIMDINHPGPVMAHLSRVPDGMDVREYDGDGDWLKIYTLGLEWMVNQTDPIRWRAYNNGGLPERFIFKIPAQTPAGQYLLRMDEVNTGLEEHNAVFNSTSPAQLYPSCAQIQVESDFTDPLPQGIKIPEALQHTSPGMSSTLSMYRFQSLDADYVYPGGPLWDGVNVVQDKPVALNASETL